MQRSKRVVKKLNRFSYGDSHCRADGHAKGLPPTKTRTLNTPTKISSPTASTPTSSTDSAHESPNKIKKARQSPFKTFLSNRNPKSRSKGQARTPAVVRNNRIRFKQTPLEKSKRARECNNTVSHTLDRVGEDMFPNDKWTQSDRKNRLREPVLAYFGQSESEHSID